MRHRRRWLYAITAAMLLGTVQARATTDRVEWQAFGPEAFERARAQHKLVLLDLVAVWCHWCHVMEARTYTDPAVVAYIDAHYIPVQADHDARPDLAERYREWGWPATVILNADGQDVVKRSGYMERDPMLRLLKAVVEDSGPEADSRLAVPLQVPDSPLLTPSLAGRLQQRHRGAYDTELGGLDLAMKFLDQDSALWSLRQARQGDDEEHARLVRTLDANLNLIDPAFGGVYQYSTHGDWQHPHYEKIMKTQWANLMVYSQACTQLAKPDYCAAARQVADYLIDFLGAPDGAFYTSQDADLVQGQKAAEYFALDRRQRLLRGLPRIDKSQYSSSNGMAIEGLADLYRATGDVRYLTRARAAAVWVIRTRSLPDGGFRHDEQDVAGPYLADTLWMGRAFLALYKAEKRPEDLQRSLAAAHYIAAHFRAPRAGLLASEQGNSPLAPLPQIDQNIQAALWLADLLTLHDGSVVRSLSDHVMRYLVTPAVANARVTEAGILEADARLRSVGESASGGVARGVR